MTGLFMLDEEGLKNNPNLHFDPQNPSAHLDVNHPNFKELKKGLTPEQIEILENVTQVDGFEVDGSDEVDESMELIDPDTGEVVDLMGGEFTLDELGFIDPSRLKTLVMEAFYNYKMNNALNLINSRYDELHQKQLSLSVRGAIGSLEADNVNTLLSGSLYDSLIMESFTKEPTRVNFNLVMEEVDAGKAALAAGATVIGVALLYKLVKWFMNVWNKNGAANQSIGDNVKTITERGARLASANDIILNNQQATAELKKLIDRAGKSNINTSELNTALSSISDAEMSREQSKKVAGILLDVGARVRLGNTYSNFWQSWLTNAAVGGVAVNKAYGDATKNACDSAAALLSMATGRLEKIRNTPANEVIPDSNESEYNQHISNIDNWAKLNGFTSGIASGNFQETTNNFTNHVMERVTKTIPLPQKLDTTKANFQIFSSETFGSINEDLSKTMSEFLSDLEKTGGKEEGKIKVLGKSFGEGSGNVAGGAVNKGDNVQKDTRIREYNRAGEIFRGTMNVMRALHTVRNNLGGGLRALEEAGSVLDAK